MGSIIIGACSGDDDYDDYAGKELQTRADGAMQRSGEGGIVRVDSFPTVYEIASNSVVIAKMNKVWQQTIDYASPQGRREYGFYIFYDKSTNLYSFSDVIEGPIIANCEISASINWPSLRDGSKLCALFHTHTSLQYCDGNLKRNTGASHRDSISINAGWLPGLIYDYSGQSIISGQLKNSPHELYKYGVFRRTN